VLLLQVPALHQLSDTNEDSITTIKL